MPLGDGDTHRREPRRCPAPRARAAPRGRRPSRGGRSRTSCGLRRAGAPARGPRRDSRTPPTRTPPGEQLQAAERVPRGATRGTRRRSSVGRASFTTAAAAVAVAPHAALVPPRHEVEVRAHPQVALHLLPLRGSTSRSRRPRPARSAGSGRARGTRRSRAEPLRLADEVLVAEHVHALEVVASASKIS